MARIPLRVAHIGSQLERQINDRNISLIFIGAIPTVPLQAPLTLLRPLHAHLTQAAINGGTSKALCPVLVQRPISLSDDIEAVD